MARRICTASPCRRSVLFRSVAAHAHQCNRAGGFFDADSDNITAEAVGETDDGLAQCWNFCRVGGRAASSAEISRLPALADPPHTANARMHKPRTTNRMIVSPGRPPFADS